MFRLSSIYQAIISITILTILYYKEVFVSYYKINVLCPHICTQLQLVSINHHYWYFLVHLHCSSLIFSCIVPSQYTIIDLISKIMDLLILTLLVLTKQTSLYSYVLQYTNKVHSSIIINFHILTVQNHIARTKNYVSIGYIWMR